jgi:hypothetical protein
VVELTKGPHTRDARQAAIVDRLADQLDALSAHVEEQLSANRRGERNRLSLLYLHALFALFTSPLFFAWAVSPAGFRGTTWQLLAAVPLVEVLLPMLLFIGGSVLTLGTAARSMRAAGIGLLLVFLWYAIIGFSFAGAVFLWLDEGAPNNAWPAVYAPFVYGHLAAIMWIHLKTVWVIVRALGR